MPSVQDIREKIEKLRGRLSLTVSGIDEAQATLAAAEVGGRPANGKLAALHALIFRRDVLGAEVRKLQAVDLPGAEAAQAAAERAKSLALARRIHAGRVKSAQALDEAMAAVDRAWANYRAGESYYLEVLRDAGVPRKAPNWRRFLQRAALASMPVVCGVVEVPGVMRTVRRPAAELEAGLMRPDGTSGNGERARRAQPPAGRPPSVSPLTTPPLAAPSDAQADPSSPRCGLSERGGTCC